MKHNIQTFGKTLSIIIIIFMYYLLLSSGGGGTGYEDFVFCESKDMKQEFVCKKSCAYAKI
jgi:hypothetical protein